MEVDISALMKRIQSVSYIPTYSDGKATVYFIKGVDKVSSQLTLDFEISPKDAVAELAEIWQQALSIKAVYTPTRAVELIDMPLTNVEVDDANGVISVTSSAENLSAEFASDIQQASARLAISDGITEVTIPNGVVVLGRGAFCGCSKLERVYFCTDNLLTIEDITFKNCGYLTYVELPQLGLMRIGNSAFEKCTNLENAYLPDTLREIGDYAYAECTKITSLSLPSSVERIGASAFYNCRGLSWVFCHSTTPPSLGGGAFDKNSTDRYFFVPESAIADYQSASVWKNYKQYIDIMR